MLNPSPSRPFVGGTRCSFLATGQFVEGEAGRLRTGTAKDLAFRIWPRSEEKELSGAVRIQTVIVYCVLGLAWRYAFKNYLLEDRSVPETLDRIKNLDAG